MVTTESWEQIAEYASQWAKLLAHLDDWIQKPGQYKEGASCPVKAEPQADLVTQVDIHQHLVPGMFMDAIDSVVATFRFDGIKLTGMSIHETVRVFELYGSLGQQHEVKQFLDGNTLPIPPSDKRWTTIAKVGLTAGANLKVVHAPSCAAIFSIKEAS